MLVFIGLIWLGFCVYIAWRHFTQESRAKSDIGADRGLMK